MHPLNGIKGGCICGASCIYNIVGQQLLANANDIHRSHLQLFINFKKLTVEFGQAPFVEQTPVAQGFALQEFAF
ncbi:hypothetical protein D9M71_243080 [compost metagenome]